MNDPIRLREAGSEAPEGLRKLLQRTTPTQPMTDAEKARTRAKIEQSLAANHPTVQWPFFLEMKKHGRCFAIGLATLAAGASLILGSARNCAYRCEPLAEPGAAPMTPPINATRERSQNAPSNTETNDTETSAKGTPRSHSLANIETTTKEAAQPGTNENFDIQPSPPINGTVDPSAHSKSAPRLSPRDAIVLLLDAKRYLAENNPAIALAQIDQYAQSFPTRSLNTDAEFIAMDALIDLGRKDEAHARGLKLLKESVGTPDEPRVQERLAGIGRPNPGRAQREDTYAIIVSRLDARANENPQDASTLIWLRGISTWRFETNLRLPTGLGERYRAVVFGDVDGDGLVDLIALDADEQAVWRGLDGGGFGAPILVGADLQVEIDDLGNNNAEEWDDAFRHRIVVHDDDAFRRDWFERWNALGIESMLDSARDVANMPRTHSFLDD